jgi:microcystin-dependent protein
MWGGTLANIPTGWLHCDGSKVSQATYQELFNAIGDNFGVNPSQGFFYLPDLRGRFIRGVDSGAGRDPDVNSRTDMQNNALETSAVGSVQSFALQDHVHSYQQFPVPASGNGIAGGSYWAYGTSYSGTASPTASQASVSVSTETRPTNAYLYFIIKT